MVLAPAQSVDIDKAIEQMVEIIVGGWNPVQIVLFGSRARGDFHEYSDVDLLVVLDEIVDYFGQRSEIDRALACTKVRRDVKLATPAEVVRKATVAGTIERAAMVEGKTLHVRGRGDPVSEAVLERLELTRRDLRGGRLQLAADPTEPVLACFYVHQSSEKALKAALVAERIDPPRIHELNELRDLLPDGWEIPGTVEEFKRISGWAEAARYTLGYEDMTVVDAAWGITMAQSIHDAVASELVSRGMAIE